MRIKLSFIFSLLLCSSIIFQSVEANDYVCQEAYAKKLKKYKKFSIRTAFKYGLPLAGAVYGVDGTYKFFKKKSDIGEEGAMWLTILTGGLPAAFGGMIGTQIFKLFDKSRKIIKASALLDISKYTQEDLRKIKHKGRVNYRVRNLNYQRSLNGLPNLTKAEIATISSTLDYQERDKNLLDKMVKKLNKKLQKIDENINLDYDDVRGRISHLGTSSSIFCPESKKGKLKPITYKKLKRITLDSYL